MKSKRLTEPQMRALREIRDGHVAQDRVARFYVDGRHDRMRERSIRVVVYRKLATHRSSSVKGKQRFIPIDLTDRGRKVLSDD